MSDPETTSTQLTTVTRRYVRVERLASTAFALAAVAVGIWLFLSLPFLWGIAAALGVAALVRVPIYRTTARSHLRTDDDPATVRVAFEGPRPPPLALQWGLADDIKQDDGGVLYRIRYLMGLRSVDFRVVSELGVSSPDGPAQVDLTVTTNGRDWGSYTVRIEAVDSGTEVTVRAESDRRFGLRRLPQFLVAQRYLEQVMAAQGYELCEGRSSVTL